MKKLVRATKEMPAGYLTTNKFNAPFINSVIRKEECISKEAQL